jgi:hypothetical protein
MLTELARIEATAGDVSPRAARHTSSVRQLVHGWDRRMDRDVVCLVATEGAFGATIVSAAITASTIQIAGNGIDDALRPGVAVAGVFGSPLVVASLSCLRHIGSFA